jgi:hypothetical protein
VPVALPPKRYQVFRENAVIGDFEPSEFFESISRGQIQPDDWYLTDGMSEWKLVETLVQTQPQPQIEVACHSDESDESELPKMQRPELTVSYWLRWIAVLPAAVAAYFVVQILYALFNWFLPDLLVQALNSWIGPISFVGAGAYTAPSHRFQVALGLSIVLSAVVISVVALYALVVKQFGWHFVWLVVCMVISVASTVSICMNFLKEQHDEEMLRQQFRAG